VSPTAGLPRLRGSIDGESTDCNEFTSKKPKTAAQNASFASSCIGKQVDSFSKLSERGYYISPGTEKGKEHIMNRSRLQAPASSPPLPRPPAPPISAGSFVTCPIGLFQGFTSSQLMCQSLLYQVAFAQAQEVARPSLPERDLLAVWN
jgi:hypothetical protein